MTPPTCARPGCGNPLAAKPTGRPGRYCSDACRNATRRAAGAKQARVEHLPTPAPETRQRPSYDVGDGDHCPQDARHGHMFVLPSSLRPGERIQYCSHSAHRGPDIFAFDGLTPVPASRPAADDPVAIHGAQRPRDQLPTEATRPVTAASGASRARPAVPVAGGGGPPGLPLGPA